MAPLRDAGHIKYEDPARVVDGFVAINVSTYSIFDFNTGNIVLSRIVTHDYVSTLTYINAGVGCRDGNIAFEKSVRGLDRVDTVSPVIHVGAICPFRPDTPNGNVIALINL